MKRLPLVRLLLTLLVAGCAQAPAPPQPSESAAVGAVPVGEGVTLLQGTATAPALDLVVQVFDRGLAEAGSGSVFPSLRKAESIVLPVMLSQTLRDSGYFGAVRVVRSGEVVAPLAVSGRIVHADGLSLVLDIQLEAADGSVLLTRRYRDESREADFPVKNGVDPFADLFRFAANDIARAAEALTPAARRSLEQLALLRFGAELAPGSFGGYLEAGPGNTLRLRSLPAQDDPMLGRLARVKRQDELFVDTVDEQYRELAERIAESYDLWRQYSRELALYGASYQAEVAERSRAGRRGSYAAMQQVYSSFRKVKLQEEDLRDLVDAFAGESLESVVTVDDRVVRLRGSVEERYAEWQQLLARIYALETGGELPPSP